MMNILFYCPFKFDIKSKDNKSLGGIESLNIDLVDAKQESYKQDLMQNGGKQKVPCLKVELKNKPVRWIYESKDIIEFISKELKIR